MDMKSTSLQFFQSIDHDKNIPKIYFIHLFFFQSKYCVIHAFICTPFASVVAALANTQLVSIKTLIVITKIDIFTHDMTILKIRIKSRDYIMNAKKRKSEVCRQKIKFS